MVSAPPQYCLLSASSKKHLPQDLTSMLIYHEKVGPLNYEPNKPRLSISCVYEPFCHRHKKNNLGLLCNFGIYK